MYRKDKYNFFTTKEIEAKGWLLKQLQIQAKGLSGNLDKLWPDIRDSKWIGGDREGWERVPYWLDGFIPLAYFLKDQDMIDRAKKYVDAIIDGQKDDGWLCPCMDNERHNYDLWALFLILKVLVLYYDCSGDERIEGVVYRALENLYHYIGGRTIFNWAASRWFEGLISISWLYERKEEDWLIDLALLLYVQGIDYKNLYDNWKDHKPKAKWTFTTHVVSAAMSIKSHALASKFTDIDHDQDYVAEKIYSLLLENHGMATGHFTGDECFAGDSPIQGTELCSVAEAMYSYEKLFEITGKTKWIDRLEKLAFNAFPATNSEDMWTHQYVQMTNQIECSKFKGKPIFYTNGPEANLFGLEPNYGCCTANFNQAWPKFALSSFAYDDKGIYSVALSPASLKTKIKSADVTIDCVTDYPFSNKVTYRIKTKESVSFDFGIRIPAFSDRTRIDGQEVEGDMHIISREWKDDTIEVDFSFNAKLVTRPEDMYALWYGPLLFSLPIEERWVKHEYERDGVTRKFPYCDYEIFPESKWNYAFASNNFNVSVNGIKDRPFSREYPPVTIETDMYEIDWGFEPGYDNVCARIPKDRKPIRKKKIVLIPYGSTNLRMSEMPHIGK